MEGLKTLIRNLAFILLLATFLEMLLPGEKMKGFVRMVMGLFVIAAIMTPITDFLRLDFNNEVPAWVNVSSTDMPVMAPEDNAENIGKLAVREQYRKILVNQIKILVLAVEGVKSADIQVELENSSGGFGDYSPILKVNVVFSRQSNKVVPINPVIIGGDESNQPATAETNKEIEVKKQISSLMQIPEEIITVKEQ